LQFALLQLTISNAVPRHENSGQRGRFKAGVAMLERFFIQLSTEPETISFQQSIGIIDQMYQFKPCAFENGELHNSAGENTGACKILAFGAFHQLSEPQTLFLFGDFYQAVLANPKGDDHPNIRNFMRSGWDGIAFNEQPLSLKK
jgi:hypothetical protein